MNSTPGKSLFPRPSRSQIPAPSLGVRDFDRAGPREVERGRYAPARINNSLGEIGRRRDRVGRPTAAITREAA